MEKIFLDDFMKAKNFLYYKFIIKNDNIKNNNKNDIRISNFMALIIISLINPKILYFYINNDKFIILIENSIIIFEKIYYK